MANGTIAFDTLTTSDSKNTGTEKSKLQKKHNIQPGTDDWFKLWFAKPHLTGERPFGDKK